MCTVTYIPNGDNVFIFTSNRDEAPSRSATQMIQNKSNGKRLLYPQDALKKGSWIVLSDANQLVCILNGAFVKHTHKPPYRLSRGIMALDFFKYVNAFAFFENYNFKGIEPFTMVIFDNGALYELRWDEQKPYVKSLDVAQKHLWASCTLYPPAWQQKRQQWFDHWHNQTQQITQTAVLDFHKNAGEGNIEYDVVMNRNNRVRTTSITSIISNEVGFEMRFEDILKGEIKQEILPKSI